MSVSGGQEREGWSTLGQAVLLACRPRVLRRTIPIALIVGTVLSLVNEGGILFGGHPGGTTWAKVAANFLVPFCVSSTGYLTAVRRPRERPEG